MKKKYENFWNMYSNFFNTIKAFAQKQIPIVPQIVFYLCQNHTFYIVPLYAINTIVHYTLFTGL